MKPGTVFPAVLLCVLPAFPAGAHRTVWNLGEYTWVRLETREKGSEPNEHPADLDAAALRQGLAAIRYKDQALLETHELDGLMKALGEAFATALPGEDLVLLSNNRRGSSILDPGSAICARLFVKDGKVNVLVGEARYSFLDRVRAYTLTPVFTYGSRAQASEIALTSPQPQIRADWVAFPVVNRTVPPPMTAAGALTSIVAAPKAPAPDQENRLRALKRLRDENLITEEEYQKKKKEILDSL